MKRNEVPAVQLKSPDQNSTGEAFFGALIEADERIVATIGLRTQVESLHRELRTDKLTGLPNALAFDEAIQERISAGKKFAIAVIDVTHFKKINDKLGHDSGDKVLINSAEVIRASTELAQHTRKEDLVARLHGDEFAIVLDWEFRKDDTLTCEERVDAIKHNLEQAMVDLSDTTLPIGLDVKAAIGVAVHEPGATMQETFNLADVRMYEHKRQQHLVAGNNS